VPAVIKMCKNRHVPKNSQEQARPQKLIKRVAQKLNAPCIYLGDLGEMDEMKAVGLFEHSGVAAHPGDKGMSEIAKLILENM